MRDTIHTVRISPSRSVAKINGADGQYGGPHAMVKISDEAHPTSPTISLPTQEASTIKSSSKVRDSASRVEMVVVGGKPNKRYDISDAPHQLVLTTDASLQGWGDI